MVGAASDEASATTADLDVREKEALSQALGMGTKGARPRHAQAALRDLEDQQKARAKRLQRDALDRVLTEFTGYYRDVFALQTEAVRPAAQRRPGRPPDHRRAGARTPSRPSPASTRSSPAARRWSPTSGRSSRWSR